ncbi:hypothetical protein ACIPEN_14045 [Herbaspirillum chlorophenolicum]|uniref:Uncharacterized protein n=1 Tax=Herbaspirillum chlorophenolicum TaxID=211589 RepID=A0ABW8F0Z7_9BURK
MNHSQILDALMPDNRGPVFEDRIIARMRKRAENKEPRGLLSRVKTSALLLWLKDCADETYGEAISFGRFQSLIGLGVAEDGGYSENLIYQYMKWTEHNNVDVHLNDVKLPDKERVRVAEPASRRLTFTAARQCVERAHNLGWFEVDGDEDTTRFLLGEALTALGYIREEELAHTILNRWKRQKRWGKPIDPRWRAEIVAEDKSRAMKLLKQYDEQRIAEKTNDIHLLDYFFQEICLNSRA